MLLALQLRRYLSDDGSCWLLLLLLFSEVIEEDYCWPPQDHAHACVLGLVLPFWLGSFWVLPELINLMFN